MQEIPKETSKEAYRINLKPVDFDYKTYESVLNKIIDDELKSVVMLDKSVIEKKDTQDGSTYLFVNREKLPKEVKQFTQIGLSSKSSDDLEETLIHSIASNMAHNKDFGRLAEVYDDEIGVECQYKRYVAVYFMDDNFNLLGYTVVK